MVLGSAADLMRRTLCADAKRWPWASHKIWFIPSLEGKSLALASQALNPTRSAELMQDNGLDAVSIAGSWGWVWAAGVRREGEKPG